VRLVPCPFLGRRVELTDERLEHIESEHPDLLPAHFERLVEALADPDVVYLSRYDASSRLFTKWFSEVLAGKHVVVVVVTDDQPTLRSWVVTSYLTSKPVSGDVIWQRT
jgi:hypothetical protein